jgi:Icc-related predicted phosphoesterase
LHASELCWRKFLKATKFYGTRFSVLGGDLTGKAVVPVEKRSDGTLVAQVAGEQRTVRGETDIAELLDAIRFNGMYPWVAPRADIDAHASNRQAQSLLFDTIIDNELTRWLELAEQRLDGAAIAPLVMAGNDDPWSIDRILAAARGVQWCDDRIVVVDGHEVVSLSYANPTPWNSPRELDEDALYERIRRLVDQLESPGSAILNLHVPPHGSGLDTATEINPDLTPVLDHGAPRQIPVGSTAVRQILEEVQPVVSVHGHIHESKGEARIGKTLAVNPGSEYVSGRIHGSLVKLAGDSLVSHQFVVG